MEQNRIYLSKHVCFIIKIIIFFINIIIFFLLSLYFLRLFHQQLHQVNPDHCDATAPAQIHVAWNTLHLSCSRCLEPESISYPYLPYLGHAEAFQAASQLLGSAAVAWDRSWQNVALHQGHNRQANPRRHHGRLPGAVKKCLEPEFEGDKSSEAPFGCIGSGQSGDMFVITFWQGSQLHTKYKHRITRWETPMMDRRYYRRYRDTRVTFLCSNPAGQQGPPLKFI